MERNERNSIVKLSKYLLFYAPKWSDMLSTSLLPCQFEFKQKLNGKQKHNVSKHQITRTTIVVSNGRYTFYQTQFIKYHLLNTLYQITVIKYPFWNTIYQIPFIKYLLSNTIYQIPFIKYHLSNTIDQITFIKYLLSNTIYQILFIKYQLLICSQNFFFNESMNQSINQSMNHLTEYF